MLLYQDIPDNEEGGKHVWDKVAGDLISNTEQVSAIQNALVSWHMKSKKERFPSLSNDLRNILVNELVMELLYQDIPDNVEGGKHVWDKVAGDLMKIVTLVHNLGKW